MRILVCPHAMEIGGSQINAIELAAAVRDHGHEVIVASGPGPLVEMVRRLGLEHIAFGSDTRRLSPRGLRMLAKLARERSIDVVHGYEWPPAIAAFFGPRLLAGIPAVCTVMSMAVAPFLPRSLPLVVGTEQLRREAVASGRSAVTLLEPPVDTVANAPSFDGTGFRSAIDADPSSVLVVIVSRLARELKLEGLLAACDAVALASARGVAVQLAIVGDGPARDEVERRAAAVNARCGRRAVVLTGELADPRPAYAAADIVLGMGGSALRAMAFAKPLVVQGELGFWRTASPQSLAQFLDSGWFGLGDLSYPVDEHGLAVGAQRLVDELMPLIDSAARRRELGQFGRDLISSRFSLERAACVQEQVYVDAIAAAEQRLPAFDIAGAALGMLAHKARRKLLRVLGPIATDDFNRLAMTKRVSKAVS